MSRPNVTVSGGKLKEIPDQFNAKKWFDDKRRKRKVTCRITQYLVGGAHFWADVAEEGDWIWNSKEKTWQKPFDAAFLNGQRHSYQGNTSKGAARFIQTVIADHYSEGRHRIVWDDKSSKMAFTMYRYEGD